MRKLSIEDFNHNIDINELKSNAPKIIISAKLVEADDDEEYSEDLITVSTWLTKIDKPYETQITYEFSLPEKEEEVNVSSIMNYLSTMKIEEVAETIVDDIKGLINIGLNIIKTNTGFLWADTINDFIIPVSQNLAKSSLAEIKEEIRPQMTHLSHEYLSLIDLAYDSVQNRLFEMKTLELLTEECEFTGLHLGGSRKPDGIIYTNDLTENYGVIVDTKAYSNGYNLPISQADEMERYIRENQTRDKKINSNEWWLNFNTNIETYYFMFVAGHFIGNFANQLERISMNTGVNGTAVSITNMLLCANAIKCGNMCHEDIKNNMFNNSEYQIS